MGQKVNPVGFRLGVNRGWDSVWYAKKKDFGNYLIEDFKIREYIKKNVINSGVSLGQQRYLYKKHGVLGDAQVGSGG